MIGLKEYETFYMVVRTIYDIYLLLHFVRILLAGHGVVIPAAAHSVHVKSIDRQCISEHGNSYLC